jgi:hypothetical protein
MKIKIWPDDASMLQMNDWLAELRDDSGAEPPGDGGAVPASAGGVAPPSGDARPEVPAASSGPAEWAAPADRAAPAEGTAPADRAAPAEGAAPADRAALAEGTAPAEGAAPAEQAAPAESAAPAAATVRAVIGDQLRMPIMWCEMGSCISWHADPAALGEADARARAIDAGWLIDAFDRLVCPRCQQADPRFRACHPVVPWDRHTAMARAARIAAGPGDQRAYPAAGRYPGYR